MPPLSDDDVRPAKAAFVKALAHGQHQVLHTRLIADTETPVSAMLKFLTDPVLGHAPAFLLESVEGGETRGRYSIIGLDPDLIWRCRGERAEICHPHGAHPQRYDPEEDATLVSLERLLRNIRFDLPDGLPPSAAGLIGYHGFDMIRRIETLPNDKPDPIGLPDACLMRPTVMVIFDAVDGVVTLAAPVWASRKVDPDAYENALLRLQRVATCLDGPLPAGSGWQPGLTQEVCFVSNTSEKKYHAMVDRAKEYIRAGDIFQVVPSQRFTARFEEHPFALYRSLRHTNPSPFLFYLGMDDFALVGSSPEILVRLRDETVTIRPIAGTRRRGKTAEEDRALEAELLADPKEIAEHLMLLDLGRNDAGRCTLPGSVTVTEKMTIERYSHVMHIVSNVEGKHDPKKSAFECMMSGFPAGTVSGAPKVRAIQIIDELEPVRRSFYAGSVGYFAADGSMDSCITLRTALVKNGMIHAQAGGGVVHDSDPAAEYQETLGKARAIMRAAEQAPGFAGGLPSTGAQR